jgi:hypothetical protein
MNPLLPEAPPNQPKWTSFFLDLFMAAGWYLMAWGSQEKSWIMGCTVNGTVYAVLAVRASTILLRQFSPLLVGLTSLSMAALLTYSGLGYYNHELKIGAVIFLYIAALYFFWEQFRRSRETQDQ